jgi:DNA-binding MarR family transcriptional regulator
MVDLLVDRNLDGALELLHFAFRAVVARPDRMLGSRGLSRVHHRILFFVRRNPGMSVGELLRILGTSKQALNAPLRTLLRKKMVSLTSAPEDRRVKRIHLTDKGKKFEKALSGDQRSRFKAVFKLAGKKKELAWREIMRSLADKHFN